MRDEKLRSTRPLKASLILDGSEWWMECIMDVSYSSIELPPWSALRYMPLKIMYLLRRVWQRVCCLSPSLLAGNDGHFHLNNAMLCGSEWKFTCVGLYIRHYQAERCAKRFQKWSPKTIENRQREAINENHFNSLCEACLDRTERGRWNLRNLYLAFSNMLDDSDEVRGDPRNFT